MKSLNWKIAILAGINQSAMTPVVTLLRHFAFVLPLIFLINKDLNLQQA